MIYFVICFWMFLNNALANPFPAPLAIESTFDEVSFGQSVDDPILPDVPSNSDIADCNLSTSTEDLTDGDYDSGPDANIIRRRGSTICPVTKTPTIREEKVRILEDLESSFGLPSYIKSPNDVNDYCRKPGYPVHVTCSGPELRLLPDDEMVLWVINCAIGALNGIEARGPWPERKKVAQYCCQRYVGAKPGYAARHCFQLQPKLEMRQWGAQDVLDFLRDPQRYLPPE